MNKLSLNVDDLRVDSFRTARQPTERGTVNAHDADANTAYCTSIKIGCWCTEQC